MSNLKDYLKEFEAETLPGDIEPEADESETVAQVTENDTSHYDQTAQKSNLRPIEMLNDPKYTGVKVTREQLDQSSDDESADEDMEDDDEEEMLSKINQEKETKIDGNEEDEDYTKLYAVEAGEDEELEDDEMSEDENVSDAGSGEEKDVLGNLIDDDDEILSDDEDIGELGNLEIFNRKKVVQTQNDDVTIGKGIIAQCEVYDKMIQARIRLQKLLSLAAQLPQNENIEKFNAQSSDDVKNKYNHVKDKLYSTYNSIVDLNAEFNKSEPIQRKRKGNFENNDQVIKERWSNFEEKRKKIFGVTWESVKHGASGNDPNMTVNSILSDPDRLQRRSKLKKSFTARRLGEEKVSDVTLDAEQYDDTGLYQAILRNLINSKVKRGSENDADELNRHWLKLQRNERKSKKANVDTKASKGRKIRYNINQKLVGFLPKADQAKWTHQQRNQLFRGVFQCQ